MFSVEFVYFHIFNQSALFIVKIIEATMRTAHDWAQVFVILGFVFNLKITEWALIFIALGITLACELINTSIEAVVDMVTLEIHPLAKIAKDCGSAATFVLTLVSFVIILLVFVPYFI